MCFSVVLVWFCCRMRTFKTTVFFQLKRVFTVRCEDPPGTPTVSRVTGVAVFVFWSLCDETGSCCKLKLTWSNLPQTSCVRDLDETWPPGVLKPGFCKSDRSLLFVRNNRNLCRWCRKTHNQVSHVWCKENEIKTRMLMCIKVASLIQCAATTIFKLKYGPLNAVRTTKCWFSVTLVAFKWTNPFSVIQVN